MAELNARIIAKASATAAEEPVAGDLEVAELAVNTADGKLFTKHTDGSVVTISGGGGGAVDSVNGETGVVSLGIQDMDDFELAEPMGSITWSTFVSSITPPPETWSKSSIWLYVSVESDGPVDRTTELTTLTTGDFITLTDSTGYTVTEQVNAVVPDLVSQGGTYDRVQIDFTNYSAWADTVNTTGSLTIESIAFSAGEVPLAEGDILQWNDTDQKFNPAQQEIQNMNDFELNQADQTATFAGPINSAPRTSDEWFANTTTSSYFVWWTDSANDARMQTLEIGDAVTFTFDGGAELTTTVVHPGVSDAGDEQWFPVADTWPTEAGSATECVVSSPRFLAAPAQDIPLADGDTLQWNDSDQKFKPAQLPDPAVGSVNGETGVISLGIQDMDDFELNSIPFQAFEYTTESSGNPQPGEYGFYNSSGGEYNVRMSYTDANGLDLEPTVEALPATGPFWTSADGVTYTERSYLELTQRTADQYLYIQYEGPSFYQGSGLFISFSAPEGTPALLADGDILQWVDADQKFKPAQLPAGGGAVDSVNGETGVVSLGIQDMGDFELSYASATKTWSNTMVGSSSSLPSPDRCVLNASGDIIYFNHTVGGVDISSDVLLLDGANVTLSLGGIEIVTTLSLYPGGNYGTYSFYNTAASLSSMVTAVQSDPNLSMTVDCPAWSAALVPLASGDVLQWVDIDQAFKPAQLPDATATRALLGIGEYIDDAAAGTDGVTSGAMYYNTTSSDYRLKS